MRIGVVGNPRYEDLPSLLGDLAAWAANLGLSVFPEGDLASVWPGECAILGSDGSLPLDLLVTFGGDGTLLRGARLLGESDTPILGVNLGRVGFLNSAAPDTLREALEAFGHGRYTLEIRRTLDARVFDASGKELDRGRALNDVVVHKAGVARVIQLLVSVNDDLIGQYSADGIIVATPTGSTAYSLSAGGPLVMPGVDALVINAICPHTLAVRPIVVAGDSVVRMESAPPFTDEVLVSIDGQVGTTLEPGGTVEIGRGSQPIKLVQVGTEGFFQRVRRKLQWGDLSDREKH